MSAFRSVATGGGHICKGSLFSSYQDFQASYAEWQKDGSHPMRIARSDKNPFCSGVSNVPFPYLRVHFSCRHAGSPGVKGNNIRTNQRYNGKGCNVKLTLLFRGHPQSYEVVNLVEAHNHATSPELFMWYPQNRALSNSSELDNVPLLNAKPKDIKEAIYKETGLRVTSQDIRN